MKLTPKTAAQTLSSLRASRKNLSFFAASVGIAMGLLACSIFATRPVQEMSDTAAAIKAAKEVDAETVAPELYRQATDLYLKAKSEYRLKNFSRAKDYLDQAREFAEQAEFEALKGGSARSDVSPKNESEGAPAPQPSPYEYPKPTGTPVETFASPPPSKP